MKQTAEIVQFQKKQEAKFACSACGADRVCDCNAPAIERLAGIREIKRQQQRRYREKAKENKGRVDTTGDNTNLLIDQVTNGVNDFSEQVDEWLLQDFGAEARAALAMAISNSADILSEIAERLNRGEQQ